MADFNQSPAGQTSVAGLGGSFGISSSPPSIEPTYAPLPPVEFSGDITPGGKNIQIGMGRIYSKYLDNRTIPQQFPLPG